MNERPTDASVLEAEKRRLYEEIRNYPTPIAACDQQFNYLLEQHARVTAELNRLRSARSVACTQLSGPNPKSKIENPK